MAIASMAQIQQREIDDYLSKKTPEEKKLFEGLYLTAHGSRYSAIVVLNFIVNRYNDALFENKTHLTLLGAQFDKPSTIRMCRFMIPFFKDVRNVFFRPASSNIKYWNILQMNPESLNEFEWQRLPLVPAVRKPSLRMKG